MVMAVSGIVRPLLQQLLLLTQEPVQGIHWQMPKTRSVLGILTDTTIKGHSTTR